MAWGVLFAHAYQLQERHFHLQVAANLSIPVCPLPQGSSSARGGGTANPNHRDILLGPTPSPTLTYVH